MILQNPFDEQVATSVDSLWKGHTNHERLRTTAFDHYSDFKQGLSIRFQLERGGAVLTLNYRTSDIS